MAQRLVIVIGFLVAAGVGYLLWGAREAPAPVVTEAPSPDAGKAPTLAGLKGRAGKDVERKPAAKEETAGAAAAGTTLLVHALHTVSAAPLAGVLVRLKKEEGDGSWMRASKTDESGVARFEGLEPGDYVIRVKARSFPRGSAAAGFRLRVFEGTQ